MRTMLPESVMSNFDHTIKEDVAQQLRENPEAQAQYAGWNFCGYVSWLPDEECYSCEVWRYHSLVETVKGTLPEIMERVSETYGYE